MRLWHHQLLTFGNAYPTEPEIQWYTVHKYLGSSKVSSHLTLIKLSNLLLIYWTLLYSHTFCIINPCFVFLIVFITIPFLFSHNNEGYFLSEGRSWRDGSNGKGANVEDATSLVTRGTYLIQFAKHVSRTHRWLTLQLQPITIFAFARDRCFSRAPLQFVCKSPRSRWVWPSYPVRHRSAR